MSSVVFNAGAEGLCNGSITWGSDTIRARLCLASDVPDPDATSMTGIGLAATDLTVTSKTGPTKDAAADRIIYDCADLAFPAVAAVGEVDKVVLFKFVTNDAGSTPIAQMDIPSIITNGGAVNVGISADGAFFLSNEEIDAPTGFAPATYSRSSTLTDDLLAVLPDMVPRASDGTPDAGGRMYMVGIGMSNARDYHGIYTNLLNSGDYLSLKATGFRFYRASQSGHVASDWANPLENAWSQAVTGIINNGGTAAQVLHVDTFMTQSFPDTDGVMTATQCQAIVANAKATFPNLLRLTWHSIAYTGWSTDGRAPLYSVHSDDALLATQVGLIHGVLCDYEQVYSEGETYNNQRTSAESPDGIRWLQASDFEADFVHPSTAGATKMARFIFSCWLDDPTMVWAFPA